MDTLNIALVQTHLIWEDPRANRDRFEEIFKGLRAGTQLVVLPEMFTSGFTMDPEEVAESMDGPTVRWLQDMARNYELALAGSVVVKEGEKYRNRFLFVYPDGKLSTYDKRHSFTLAGEHTKYASGESREVITYKGWRIFPQICYDLRFPVFSRNDLDYDMLIYVANWPARRINAWDALLKARAIENMAYCLGVNRIGTDANGHEYPGHTAAYDALGNTMAYSETEEVLYVAPSRVKMMEIRDKLKFLEDRDRFRVHPE